MMSCLPKLKSGLAKQTRLSGHPLNLGGMLLWYRKLMYHQVLVLSQSSTFQIMLITSYCGILLHSFDSTGNEKPTYPSSKPKRVDWDKLEAQVKKEVRT